jgi:hypothetical protein
VDQLFGSFEFAGFSVDRELGAELAGWSDTLIGILPMKLSRILFIPGAFALAVASQAVQVSAPGFKDNVNGHPDFGPTAPGVHLETNLGSFAIKRGNELPNIGTLDIAFTGTLLIGGFKGTLEAGPGVKLAYSPKGINRQVYHGSGTLKFKGEFVKVLFFGRDMHALYKGSGVIEVSGEFDKDLNTGWYWYDGDFKDKRYWMTGVMQVPVSPPKQQAQTQGPVKVRTEPGKGG